MLASLHAVHIDLLMPTASSFYPRVFALAVAAALGYALLLIFTPFVGSMAWAAFLAFLILPLNMRWRRFFRRRGTAAGVLTVLAPVVILLPLSAVSIEFVSQISALLQKLQQAAKQWDIKTFADLRQFPWIAHANDWLQGHAGISAAQVQSWLVSGTQQVLQRAAGFGGSFFLGALDSLLGFAIMLFLLFFFLRDGDDMIARARQLIPLDEARKERLFDQLGSVTRAIMFGTSVTALAQGLLIAVGFAIASLPSPVVFGVLAALFSLLPIGGAAFVWGPAVLWLFFDGRWGFAIFMLAWGLMLGGLDNVLRPLLISGRAKVSALAVFIGVLGGIPAFGAIGVIVGPVVLSLAIALIEFAEEARTGRT
ncbi:MAG: AI-2E family transporter [Pseudomonadota bacterium]|nr:AI-2E family transporter [Pseudomonadota bacterium]